MAEITHLQNIVTVKQKSKKKKRFEKENRGEFEKETKSCAGYTGPPCSLHREMHSALRLGL